MADYRDLALRHLVKAQRETMIARAQVSLDLDAWNGVDEAHAALTHAIDLVNRIPREVQGEPSDDGAAESAGEG